MIGGLSRSSMGNSILPFCKRSVKKRCYWVVVLLVGGIALLPALTILDAQFRGEDEILTLRAASKVADSLHKGQLKSALVKLIRDYHPPARTLVVIPFLAFLGPNEVALRLPNVLLWVAACLAAAQVGRRLAGAWTGLYSGLFLAVSGLFNLQAMGLGHVGETLWILLMIDVLLQESHWDFSRPETRKRYLLGAFYCAIGFLWFTSLLPVCGLYHVFWGVHVLRRRSRRAFRRYVLLSLPWFGFYLVYYALFLGWPAYLWYTGQVGRPFGQLGQNLFRANASYLNIISLQQNLRVLNGYVFPWISWLMLILGMWFQARHYPTLFVVLLGYGVIWSFYFTMDTAQHFLAYFCWLLPFGAAAWHRFLSQWNRRVSLTGCILVLSVMSVWTYYIHIKTYTHNTYPTKLLTAVWGSTLWRNNLDRPMQALAQDMQRALKADERFIVLADGAFPLYYFPDERYLQRVHLADLVFEGEHESRCLHLPEELRRAYHIRAAVSFTTHNFCEKDREDVIRYPGSDLQLTVFSEAVL